MEKVVEAVTKKLRENTQTNEKKFNYFIIFIYFILYIFYL